MIVCYSPKMKSKLIVDSVIGRDGYDFGNWYLIGIGCGFDTHTILVKAMNEGDVMDIYADSTVCKGTLIDRKELDKCYLQDGRKQFRSYLSELMSYVDDMEDQLMNPDFTPDEAERGLDDLLDATKDLINNINSLGEWNSNGPHSEEVMWIGNYSDPHTMELRIFEHIPKDQIHFFHPRCSHLELTNEPFNKSDFIRSK